MRFEGVFVAHATPFQSDGSLHLPRLKQHLEWLVSQGVHGLVPCGTTGESATLSRRERVEVIQTAREVASRAQLPVIAGCGGNDTARVLELVQEARELGCDAALVVTPYYNKPTQAGLLAHYRSLADRSEFPIVLYNVPGRTAVSMTVETTASLLEHPFIIGIKEASGSYAHWLGLSQTLDLSAKSWLAGDDDAQAITQMLGGTGIISASANVAPKAFVAIHTAAREQDWQRAFSLQKAVNPLVRALFAETSPAPLKFALQELGFGPAHLRLPLVPVTSGTEAQVRAALRGVETLR